MTPPISVVFDAYHLYHLPQFDPVIDLLKNDSRFKVYLTISNSIEPEEYAVAKKIVSQKGVEVILADNPSDRRSGVQSVNPDWFICGWSRYGIDGFVRDNTMVGMIYHGIGVKPSYWRDNHKRLDVRFVEGDFRDKQLKEKGVHTKTVLTGFPKLDPLFNDSLPKAKDMVENLRLDPNKKTILYAPTFYPSSFEKLWKQFIPLEEYNIIIKLHSWVNFLKSFGGVNLTPQLNIARRLSKTYPHIYLAPGEDYNIIPYLHMSDILITEASSTIYEMHAVKKPVIVCDFYKLRASHRLQKKRLFNKRLDKEMVEELTQYCLHMKTPRDARRVIRQALEDHSLVNNPSFDDFMKDMLFQFDGKSSERIRDFMLQYTNRGLFNDR